MTKEDETRLQNEVREEAKRKQYKCEQKCPYWRNDDCSIHGGYASPPAECSDYIRLISSNRFNIQTQSKCRQKECSMSLEKAKDLVYRAVLFATNNGEFNNNNEIEENDYLKAYFTLLNNLKEE